MKNWIYFIILTNLIPFYTYALISEERLYEEYKILLKDVSRYDENQVKNEIQSLCFILNENTIKEYDLKLPPLPKEIILHIVSFLKPPQKPLIDFLTEWIWRDHLEVLKELKKFFQDKKLFYKTKGWFLGSRKPLEHPNLYESLIPLSAGKAKSKSDLLNAINICPWGLNGNIVTPPFTKSEEDTWEILYQKLKQQPFRCNECLLYVFADRITMSKMFNVNLLTAESIKEAIEGDMIVPYFRAALCTLF